jgi:hypothetical protein
LICRMRNPSCLAKMIGECPFLSDWWHESQANKETLLGKMEEAIVSLLRKKNLHLNKSFTKMFQENKAIAPYLFYAFWVMLTLGKILEFINKYLITLTPPNLETIQRLRIKTP